MVFWRNRQFCNYFCTLSCRKTQYWNKVCESGLWSKEWNPKCLDVFFFPFYPHFYLLWADNTLKVSLKQNRVKKLILSLAGISTAQAIQSIYKYSLHIQHIHVVSSTFRIPLHCKRLLYENAAIPYRCSLKCRLRLCWKSLRQKILILTPAVK